MAGRRFTPRGSQRGATDWARLVVAHTTVASGKALLATFALSNPGIGETVRRTRGMFDVVSDQSSVTEQQNGALGFMIVSDLAAAAGAASIPGPITDASDDGWFVWEPFTQVSQFTLGVSNAAAAQGAAIYPFDSKAMRKVADGFTIVCMVEVLSQGCEIGLAVSLLGSRT